MPNKLAGSFDNHTAPASSGQFGPFNLPGVSKLLAARVNITAEPGISTVTTSSTEAFAAMIGMQVVFQGDSPFGLPSGAGLVNFLDHMPWQSSDTIALWSPSTDTAGYIPNQHRRLTWNGQKFFGAGLDFYVTWGSTYVSVNQVYSGYFEVVYT